MFDLTFTNGSWTLQGWAVLPLNLLLYFMGKVSFQRYKEFFYSKTYYFLQLSVADDEEQSLSEEEYDEENPMSVEEWLPNRMKVREREREREKEENKRERGERERERTREREREERTRERERERGGFKNNPGQANIFLYFILRKFKRSYDAIQNLWWTLHAQILRSGYFFGKSPVVKQYHPLPSFRIQRVI